MIQGTFQFLVKFCHYNLLEHYKNVTLIETVCHVVNFDTRFDIANF